MTLWPCIVLVARHAACCMHRAWVSERSSVMCRFETEFWGGEGLQASRILRLGVILGKCPATMQ
jgi:hypothetical protein